MAKVTLSLLSKRQLKNLEKKNNEWLKDGLVTPIGTYWNHCSRCVDLGIGVEFQPIENFNYQASRGDGCSCYCTKCQNSGLTKADSLLALEHMGEHNIAAEDGELMLQRPCGSWAKASEVDDAKDTLHYSIVNEIARKDKLSLFGGNVLPRLVFLGLFTFTILGLLWNY